MYADCLSDSFSQAVALVSHTFVLSPQSVAIIIAVWVGDFTYRVKAPTRRPMVRDGRTLGCMIEKPT